MAVKAKVWRVVHNSSCRSIQMNYINTMSRFVPTCVSESSGLREWKSWRPDGGAWGNFVHGNQLLLLSSVHFIIRYWARRYFSLFIWQRRIKKRENRNKTSAHLCLRLRWTRGGSSDGALKMDLKMGTYFLKMTAETVKFLSSLSVLWRKSCARLVMSCHFFILLKNSIRLQGEQRPWPTGPQHRC